MSTSGKLAADMAGSLDVPVHVLTTLMKVLRGEKAVTRNGRGTSAALMTEKDAATMLLGFASAAPPAHIIKATEILMTLPLRAVADPRLKRARSDDTFGDHIVRYLGQRAPDAERPDIEIGLNVSKSEGYAILEYGGMKAVFSVWPIKKDAVEVNPFTMFDRPPACLTAVQLPGRVFDALRKSLDEPIVTTRNRHLRPHWQPDAEAEGDVVQLPGMRR